MVDAAKGIAELLQLYGGWGVSAVLIVALWAMAKHIGRMNSERLADQRKSNEEMLQLMEKRIEADLRHADAFKSLREIVSKLIERM